MSSGVMFQSLDSIKTDSFERSGIVEVPDWTEKHFNESFEVIKKFLQLMGICKQGIATHLVMPRVIKTLRKTSDNSKNSDSHLKIAEFNAAFPIAWD